MERVSDVFAFGLSNPNLWSGLLFHDPAANGKIRGITDAEWQALAAARPHLELSIRTYLRHVHEAIKGQASRSKAKYYQRLTDARHHVKRELPWLRAEVPLVGSVCSASFGLSDDLGHAVRPFLNLWTKLEHQTVLYEAADKCPHTDGIERQDEGQVIVWYFPVPAAGQSFEDIAENMVATTWTGIEHLCRKLQKTVE